MSSPFRRTTNRWRVAARRTSLRNTRGKPPSSTCLSSLHSTTPASTIMGSLMWVWSGPQTWSWRTTGCAGFCSNTTELINSPRVWRSVHLLNQVCYLSWDYAWYLQYVSKPQPHNSLGQSTNFISLQYHNRITYWVFNTVPNPNPNKHPLGLCCPLCTCGGRYSSSIGPLTTAILTWNPMTSLQA